MRVAAFCGTFDPITLGHLNIIARSAKLFDKVVVIVSVNRLKNHLFSEEQRLQWVIEATSHLENVECHIYNGLVADACKEFGVDVLVRGIRNGIDSDYEQNMAYMNQEIHPGLDTICLFTDNHLRFCSSSNVRELLKYNLDISRFVPQCVLKTLNQEAV